MSHTIDDLTALMARLRDPDTGCPWDIRQTYRSIVPHTLEEAHEVADAIEREDYLHLKDELGDLLFQVIFYTQMGREDGHFSFDDVVDHLVRKLIRRHPHVFPDGTLQSRIDPDQSPDEAQIRENWERIKAEERAERAASAPVGGSDAADDSRLAGIARSLPAMVRAEKLQRRASRFGFDWTTAEPVFDKVCEEAGELREVWDSPGRGAERQDALEDEMGDLLFACVNLARFMKVNPDQALRRTNQKFETRFRAVEQRLDQTHSKMQEASRERLEALWQEVKGVEKPPR